MTARRSGDRGEHAVGPRDAETLQRHRDQSTDLRTQERASDLYRRALEIVRAGGGAREVRERLGLGSSQASRWAAMCHEDIDAESTKRPPGRAPGSGRGWKKLAPIAAPDDVREQLAELSAKTGEPQASIQLRALRALLKREAGK